MPTKQPPQQEPSKEIARQRPRTIEELKALVLQGKDEIAVDPKEVEERIFDRMMSATSPNEVLGASTTTKADDIIGKNMTMHGVHFNESDMGDGLGIYAVIDATVDGERHAVTVGARTIVAQLLKFDYEGWFPVVVKIHKTSKPTKSGFYPMELVPGDPVEEQF